MWGLLLVVWACGVSPVGGWSYRGLGSQLRLCLPVFFDVASSLRLTGSSTSLQAICRVRRMHGCVCLAVSVGGNELRILLFCHLPPQSSLSSSFFLFLLFLSFSVFFFFFFLFRERKRTRCKRAQAGVRGARRERISSRLHTQHSPMQGIRLWRRPRLKPRVGRLTHGAPSLSWR